LLARKNHNSRHTTILKLKMLISINSVCPSHESGCLSFPSFDSSSEEGGDDGSDFGDHPPRPELPDDTLAGTKPPERAAEEEAGASLTAGQALSNLLPRAAQEDAAPQTTQAETGMTVDQTLNDSLPEALAKAGLTTTAAHAMKDPFAQTPDEADPQHEAGRGKDSKKDRSLELLGGDLDSVDQLLASVDHNVIKQLLMQQDAELKADGEVAVDKLLTSVHHGVLLQLLLDQEVQDQADRNTQDGCGQDPQTEVDDILERLLASGDVEAILTALAEESAVSESDVQHDAVGDTLADQLLSTVDPTILLQALLDDAQGVSMKHMSTHKYANAPGCIRQRACVQPHCNQTANQQQTSLCTNPLWRGGQCSAMAPSNCMHLPKMPPNLQDTLSKLHSKAEVPRTVRRVSHEDSDEDCGGSVKGNAGNKRKGKGKIVKDKSGKSGKNGKNCEHGATKNGKGKSSKGKSRMNHHVQKVGETVAALSGGAGKTKAAKKDLDVQKVSKTVAALSGGTGKTKAAKKDLDVRQISKTAAALSGGAGKTKAAKKDLDPNGASKIIRTKAAKVDVYAVARAHFVERFSAPAGTTDSCRAKLSATCWLTSPERAAAISGMSHSERKRRRFDVTEV